MLPIIKGNFSTIDCAGGQTKIVEMFAPPRRSASSTRHSTPTSASNSRHASPMASTSDRLPNPEDKMYFYKLSQINFVEEKRRKVVSASRRATSPGVRGSSLSANPVEAQNDNRHRPSAKHSDPTNAAKWAVSDYPPADSSVIGSYAQQFQSTQDGYAGHQHQQHAPAPIASNSAPMTVRHAPMLPNRREYVDYRYDGYSYNAAGDAQALQAEPALEVAVPASSSAMKALHRAGKSNPKRSYSGAAIDRQVHVEVAKYLTAVFLEPRGVEEQFALGGILCFNDLRDTLDVCGLGKLNTADGRDDVWFDLQEAQRRLSEIEPSSTTAHTNQPAGAYITSLDAFVTVLKGRGAVVAARRRIELALLRAAQHRLQSPTATTKGLRQEVMLQKEYASKLLAAQAQTVALSVDKENCYSAVNGKKQSTSQAHRHTVSSEPVEVLAATKLKGYVVLPDQPPRQFTLQTVRKSSNERSYPDVHEPAKVLQPPSPLEAASSSVFSSGTYSTSNLTHPYQSATIPPASPLDPFGAIQAGDEVQARGTPRGPRGGEERRATTPRSAPLGLPPKSPVHTGRSGAFPSAKVPADDEGQSRRRIIKSKKEPIADSPTDAIESLLLESDPSGYGYGAATRRTEPFPGGHEDDGDDGGRTSPTLSQLSSSSHYEDSPDGGQHWGSRRGSPPQRRNYSPSLWDLEGGQEAAPTPQSHVSDAVRHLVSRAEAQQPHRLGTDPRRINKHPNPAPLPAPIAGSYSASRQGGRQGNLKRSEAISATDGMPSRTSPGAFQRLYEQSKVRQSLALQNSQHISRGSALTRTNSYTHNVNKMSRSMRGAESARAAAEETLSHQCTFKPSINMASHRLGTKGDVRSRLYLPTQSRLALIEADKREREAEELKLQEQLLECTFEPTIHSNPSPLPSDHVPPLYVETVSRLRYGIMERKRRPLKFSDSGYLRSEACDSTKDMKVLDEKRRRRRERSRERSESGYGSLDDSRDDIPPLAEDDPQYWAQKPVLRLRAQDGTIHDIKMTMN